MNLNNSFNHSRLTNYAAHLKSRGLSDASIKRKLSSLSSFQKFLIKKKLLSPLTPNTPVFTPKPTLPTPLSNKSRFNFPKLKNFLLNRYILATTLLIILSSLGYGLYSQTILKARKQLAYSTASSPVTPNRILSFQGRLTDSTGNPITSSTNIIFKLFTAGTGGTELYTSGTGNSATVLPDENGIFSVVIGKSHGIGISSSVFTENPEVWLEITAGGETMDPRQQIATVGYALNSESLQGLPPSASGFKNTVLVIDGTGNLNLGETSPTIKSISGTLGIEGQAILIKASDTSGGDITINPDAAGKLKLLTEGTGSTAVGGFIEATNANLASGNLYSGLIRNTNQTYNFIDFSNYLSGTEVASRFSVSAAGSVNVGSSLTVGTNLAVGGSVTLVNLPIGTGSTILYINSGGNLVQGTFPPGTTYTASNGITMSGNDFRLGGQITQNTSIGTSSSYLSLGINTTSPTLHLTSGGNVGIGTSNPVQALDVNGFITANRYYITGNTNAYIINDASSGLIVRGGYLYAEGGTTSLYVSGAAQFRGNIDLRDGGADYLYSSGGVVYINDTVGISGNLGIGLTDPLFTLHVGGTGSLGVGGSVTFSGLPVGGGTSMVYISNGVLTSGTLPAGTVYTASTGLTQVGNDFRLNVGYTNTWTAFQTFSGGVGITGNLTIGGTFVSVGSTNLVTNLNANYLNGLASSSFLQTGFTGFINSATNGLQLIGSTAVGLGGTLTQNTLIGTSSSYLAFGINLTSPTVYLSSGGLVGIGTSNPTKKLDITGDINLTGTIFTTGTSGTSGQVLTSTGTGLQWVNSANVGGTYTFVNGLTNNAGIVGLGGSLTANTLIGTSSSYLAFGINLTSPTVYLSSGGLVGIGTSNPVAKLTVDGDLSVGTSANISGNLTVGNSLTTTSLNLTTTAVGGSSVAAYLTGNSGLIGYLDTSSWDKSTSDDYVRWIANTGGTNVAVNSGTTISFTGGTDTTVLNIGNTFFIHNTATLQTVTGRGASTTNTLVLSSTGVGLSVANAASIGSSLTIGTNLGVGGSVTFSGLPVGGGTSMVYISNGVLTSGTLPAGTVYTASTGLTQVGNDFRLNVGYTNVWTAFQTFSGGVGITGNLTIGGTFVSVGSTNLVTNLNANYLNGLASSSFLQTGFTGFINSATNGLQLIGSTAVGLGGTLTANTIINTSSNSLSFLGLGNTQSLFINSNGYVGIGVTNPSYPLEIKSNTNQNLLTFDARGTDGNITNKYYIKSSRTNTIDRLSIGNDGYNDIFSVTSNGRVGIFTNIPSAVFEVNGNVGHTLADPIIRASRDSTYTGYIELGYNGGEFGGSTVGGVLRASNNLSIASSATTNILFGIGNTEIARITSSGNLGIITSAPLFNLHVGGTGSLGVGGSVTFSGLPVGGGTSMVYINSSGVLSSGTLPAGTVYTASTGLTQVGNDFRLNVGYTNTWTAFQTFSGGVGITGNLTIGGTFVSVGSTNLVTNLNANYLNGLASSSFLQTGFTGFINSATNGLQLIGSTAVGLGGTLTQATQIGVSNFPLVFTGLGGSNIVSIGSTGTDFNYQGIKKLYKNVITVNPNGGADYTTISAGVSAAVGLGATESNPFAIYIYPGTYSDNITLPGGINLIGTDRASVSIAPANTASPHITINGATTIANLNFTPGDSYWTKIINITAGAVTLTNIQMSVYVATDSSDYAIYSSAAANLTINNSVIAIDTIGGGSASRIVYGVYQSSGSANLYMDNTSVSVKTYGSGGATYAVYSAPGGYIHGSNLTSISVLGPASSYALYINSGVMSDLTGSVLNGLHGPGGNGNSIYNPKFGMIYTTDIYNYGTAGFLANLTTTTPLYVQGTNSQTANLFQWKNSSGVALGGIDSSGKLGLATTSPTFTLQIGGTGSLGVGGSVTFSNLPIGGGTSMVYISNGVLTAGTLPSGSTPYTATNGLNLNGTAFGLGGSLTANTEIGTSSFSLNIGHGNTQAIFVGSNGYVGIGTTNPLNKFNVSSDEALYVDFDTLNNSEFTSIRIKRARGVGGSPSDVVNNDGLGLIKFSGYYNSNWRTAAEFYGTVDGSPSSTYVPGKFSFATTNNSGTWGVRMVIRNDGSVGIGITSPAYKLHVAGDIGSTSLTTGNFLSVGTSASIGTNLSVGGSVTFSNLPIGGGTSMVYISNGILTSGTLPPGGSAYTATNGLSLNGSAFGLGGSLTADTNIGTSSFYLSMGINVTSPTIHLTSGGLVGIGTSNPLSALDVKGNINIAGSMAYQYSNRNLISINNTSNLYFGLDTGGTSNTTSSSRNIAIGQSAMMANTDGENNLAIGYAALQKNTTGYQNTGIGLGVLNSGTTFTNNTAIGFQSLLNNNGNENIAIGSMSMYNNTNGNNNVAIGYFAGGSSDNGSRNVFIGNGAGQNETGSDQLYIHNNNSGSPLIWGNFSTLKVGINGALGIGTTDPLYKIHVVGDANITTNLNVGGTVTFSALPVGGGTSMVYISSSGVLTAGTLPPGGSAYTATNGLNLNGSAFGLGGTLTGNTQIGTSNFGLSFIGLGGTQGMWIDKSGAVGIGVGWTGSFGTIPGLYTNHLEVADRGTTFVGLNIGNYGMNAVDEIGIYENFSDGVMFSYSPSQQMLFYGNTGMTINRSIGDFVGIGATNALSSRLMVNGNVTIGSAYVGTSAPTDGMIVQGSVGIGMDEPRAKLDIDGDVIISTNLNVGISATIGTNLSVGGSVTFSALPVGGGTSMVYISNGVLTSGTLPPGGSAYTATNGLNLNGSAFGLGGTLASLTKIDLNSNNLVLFGTGSLGIGLTNPNYKLHVAGDIGATSFTIGDFINVGTSATIGTNLSVGGSVTFSGLPVGGGTSMVYISNGVLTSGTLPPGGSAYTATNGLNLNGSAFGLGGSLTANTEIGTSNYSLTFLGLGNTQSLFIGTTGYIGIGTTNPTQLLSLYSTGNSRMTFSSSGTITGYVGIDLGGSAVDISADTNHAVRIETNNTVRLTVAAGGNVGINNTAPTRVLDIGTSIIKIIPYANQAKPTLSTDGELAIGSTGTAATGGRIWIRNNGTTFRIASAGNTADYSEFFYKGNLLTEEGDIMVTDDINNSPIPDTARTTISHLPNSNKIIGVVTNQERGTSNNNDDEARYGDPNFVNIGLLGHVWIKVNTQNGPINYGDPLTTSSTPGIAMKATTASFIVGYAAQSYTNPNPNVYSKIMAFIRPTWYDPDTNLSATGQITVNHNVPDDIYTSLGYSGSKNELETVEYNLNDSIGKPVTRIGQFAKLAVAKIESGLISTTNLIAKNIVSETSKSKTIKTAVISPLSDISDTIIVDGNLDVQGTLTAQEASFSTLYADNIVAKNGSFGDLMSDKITSLRSEMRNLISNLATTAPPIGVTTPLFTESSSWTFDIGSSQTKITGSLALTDSLVIGSKLLVLGDSQMANAFITGSLTVGNIIIRDNLIETTNSILAIQPSGQGSVNILNNTLIIADNGEVTINGNLNLNGNLTAHLARLDNVEAASASVSSSLFANLIKASDIQATTVTADKFNVATSSATIIAFDSSLATLATSSAQLASNATAGTATLPAGKTELIIYNQKITDNSLIYLTPKGSTQNQVVYLKNKIISPTPTPDDQSYFTIALDQPLVQDVDVNYWIIN